MPGESDSLALSSAIADGARIAQRFVAGDPVTTYLEPAKRATEVLRNHDFKLLPSVSRTWDALPCDPSAEALGYYHFVRFADD